MIKNEKVKLGIKIVIGLIFCVSAILKLVSIDKFELYIYSFNIVNLNLSFIIARLVIAAELGLGIGFIINCFHKFFRLLYIIALLFFSSILIYAWIIGKTGNCHCFGELFDLNPAQSLIKNAALFIALLLIKDVKEFNFKYKKLIVTAAMLGCLLTVFIVSPPDNFNLYKHKKYDVNVELLENQLNTPPLSADNLCAGRKMLCFYTTKCEYCILTANKISLIQQNNNINTTCIFNIFWGEEADLPNFYMKSGASHYNYDFINVIDFLKITNGVMPIVLLMEDGNIIKQYDYRNIDENYIVEFFIRN
jgi:hypothetical protein